MTRATTETKPNEISSAEMQQLFERAPASANDVCSCDGHQLQLRVGVATECSEFWSDLRCWFERLHAPLRAVTFERIADSADTFKADAKGRYLHVAVLHGRTADTFANWPTLVQTSLGPEVVLVGSSGLTAARFRESGASIAGELYGPSAAEEVGELVMKALEYRLPLRRIGRDMVGRVHLKDAMQLLRQAMLVAALCNNRSKRSTARLLGVTRPAVQSMARLLSVPCEADASERCGWSS